MNKLLAKARGYIKEFASGVEAKDRPALARKIVTYSIVNLVSIGTAFWVTLEGEA